MALQFLNDGYFTGKVGIGTDSPGSKLEIAGANSTTNATALFSIQKNEEGYGLFSGLYGSGASWLQSGTADGTTDYSIVMQPNGGNVGIGADSPASILQIASTGTNPYSATLDSSSNMKGIRNVLTSNSNDMVGVYFATGTSTNGAHWSGITGSRSDTSFHWGTQLNFYTHNNDVANLNQATQKMVIKGNGYVGIGTNSPDAKLHVVGKQMITTGANASPQPEDYLFIGGDGLGGANASIYIGNRGDGTGYGWRMFYEGVGSGVNNKLKFRSENLGSPVDVITMTQDGNVGIGVTGPGAKLDVDGTIRLSTSGTVEGRSYPYTTNIGSGANATTTNIRAGSTDKSEISLIGGDVGDRIEFKTNSTEKMRIDSAGAIKFNAYGAGTLVTDASGNITAVASGIGGSGTTNSIPMFTPNGTTIGNSAMSQANIGTGTAKRITVAGARMTITGNGGDADGGTLNLSSSTARLGICTNAYPGSITEPEASLDVGKNARIRGSLNVGSTNEQYLFVSTTGDTPVGYVKMGYYGQGTDYDLSDATTSCQYTTAFANGGRVCEDERIMTFKLTRSQMENLNTTPKTLIAQDTQFNYIVKEAYIYQINNNGGVSPVMGGTLALEYSSVTGGTTRADIAYTIPAGNWNQSRSQKRVMFFAPGTSVSQVGTANVVPRSAVILKTTSGITSAGSGDVNYFLRMRVKNIDILDDIIMNSQLIVVT